MADRAVITFAAAILERDDLLVLALLDDFASDAGARNRGAAVGNFFAVRVHFRIPAIPLFSPHAFPTSLLRRHGVTRCVARP